MTLKHIGSQTGKHDKPDPWKRQENRGKKKREKEEKKLLYFPRIPMMPYNVDNM
jgi:hypothetical protein